jgi:hypothetical protein
MSPEYPMLTCVKKWKGPITAGPFSDITELMRMVY